jgi:serine/threonine protein kinase
MPSTLPDSVLAGDVIDLAVAKSSGPVRFGNKAERVQEPTESLAQARSRDPRQRVKVGMLDLRLQDLYQVGRAIGRGGFATVRLAEHCESGQRAVLKSIPKADAGRSYQRFVAEAGIFEVALTMSLDHRHTNVAQYLDLLESPSRYYVVMEPLEGLHLADALTQADTIWSQRTTAAATHDLLAALRHIHGLGIYHRDVKLENLRFRAKAKRNAEDFGDLVLFDFGLARFIDQAWDKGFGGTILYAAPEVVREIKLEPSSRSSTGGYSPAVDLWAAGLLLFVFLEGDFPFEEDDVWSTSTDYSELTQEAIGGAAAPQEEASSPLKLLKGLLDADPTRRLDAASALEDPWLMSLTRSPCATAASGYSAAVTRSSASKRSKDVDAFVVQEDGEITPLSDLARSDRTLPMIPVNFGSAGMIESSRSKSSYGGDVAHKGASQTPEGFQRQSSYSLDEQTPTYISAGGDLESI